jgi:hypothetical protein
MLLAGGGLATSAVRADAVAGQPDLLTESLSHLQANYLDFASLRNKPENRLADVVADSQGKIALLPATPDASAPPMLTVLLPDGIIYCRVASYQSPTAWSDFSALLDKWISDGAQGVVLDLRSNATPDDYEGAARVASFFTPLGTPLFRVEDAKHQSRLYSSESPIPGPAPILITEPTAVLIDRNTQGSAEILAACLRNDGAVLVGESSMGRGALFARDRLSSGQYLKYLSGRVSLADGTSLWDHPINPDIGLHIDLAKEQAVLGLIAQNRVLDVIHDAAESHRLSEAALVRGEDPEIDAYLVPEKTTTTAPVPQDVVLMGALDSLKAIRLSERPTEAAAPATPSAVQ